MKTYPKPIHSWQALEWDTGFLIQNLGFAGFTTVFVALITVFKDVDSMSIRKSTFFAFYIMGLAVASHKLPSTAHCEPFWTVVGHTLA